ncbi:MAG TPA: Zn-dependent hydrolase [Tepidisphaeraceae bacterium]
MVINAQRIAADIRAISAITQTAGNGATRPTFTNEWRKACDYITEEAIRIGCMHRVDAHGNWHIRPKSLGWEKPAWLSGSHLDTVPHGGDYDGVAGVVAPLEVLRSAAEEKKEIPLELIIFAEEEGPTFSLGMLGSRSWVGDVSPKQLGELRNKHSESYLEAGKVHGVISDQIINERFNRSAYLGLIELHIEQGPGMWQRDQRLAIVTAIAGRRQYKCEILGQANHAGSTAMPDRHDALEGAAFIITSLRALVQELSPQAVATVGRIESLPNAVNVIPDRVSFTIDFRAPDDEVLKLGDEQIRELITQTCQQRGLQFKLEQTEAIPAVAMDRQLCERLSDLAGGNVPTTISGALHDSAVLGTHLPTAMLFVPSRDGISHNPAEFSRIEDIALGAELLAKAISAGPL